MFKYTFHILTLTVILWMPLCLAGQEQPNIILFLVDDLGWQDTSEPFWSESTLFNNTYRTPNMERLAREGLKFTQAYATPVCSPTRVSLLTGMNAARHRVTNWTLYKDKMQPMETGHEWLSFPHWNVNGITPDPVVDHAIYATTFPSLLKTNGYHTIHVGKAHFGAIGTPGEDPINLGFEVNIGGHAAGAPKSYLGSENYGNSEVNTDTLWAVPGLEEYHGTDIFLTEALTIEAIAALENALEKNVPFFLYMSHYGVHTPIMPDQRFVQPYYDQGMDSTEAQYAALIEGVDKSLGDIMDFLIEAEVADETIVIFMSDNGGLSAVARGGEPHTHNKPLSSGKGSIHEGGIREPMMVKYPGVTEAGSETDQYLIIEDFFPTILELAGITEYATVQTIDGQSFVPLLRGEGEFTDKRSLFWHYPNDWGPTGPGIGAFSAIRKGDWKLIYYHADQSFELFNITKDIGETTNRTGDEVQLVRILAGELGQYLREVGAQMPYHKESGLLVPYPDKLKI